MRKGGCEGGRKGGCERGREGVNEGGGLASAWLSDQVLAKSSGGGGVGKCYV